MSDKERKILIFSFAAIMFAVIGIVLPISDTAFEVVVNNTNLAPTFAGESIGTGERYGNNTTYWANNSAIELFFFGHANTPSQALHISLYVNGTQIEHTELRPLGTAERTHAYVTGIIPKGSYYSVNATQYHHYEWREYPILSGKNGTLIINQTIINNSGGASNLSQLVIDTNKDWLNYSITNISLPNVVINQSQVNNLTTDLNNLSVNKVNRSGDNLSGKLNINQYNTQDVHTVYDSGTNGNANYLSSNFDTTGNIANRNFFIQQTFSNSTNVWNGFGAWRFRYDGTYAYALKANELIYAFFAGGYKGSTPTLISNNSSTNIANANHSGGNSGLLFYSGTSDWNDTNFPTTAYLYTSNKTGTLNLLKLNENGNITIPGSPSGITMTSPNGASWCATITNLGAWSIVAGACI